MGSGNRRALRDMTTGAPIGAVTHPSRITRHPSRVTRHALPGPRAGLYTHRADMAICGAQIHTSLPDLSTTRP